MWENWNLFSEHSPEHLSCIVFDVYSLCLNREMCVSFMHFLICKLKNNLTMDFRLCFGCDQNKIQTKVYCLMHLYKTQLICSKSYVYNSQESYVKCSLSTSFALQSKKRNTHTHTRKKRSQIERWRCRCTIFNCLAIERNQCGKYRNKAI